MPTTPLALVMPIELWLEMRRGIPPPRPQLVRGNTQRVYFKNGEHYTFVRCERRGF